MKHRKIIESVVNKYFTENSGTKNYILKWEYPENKYSFLALKNKTASELEYYKTQFTSEKAEIEVEDYDSEKEFNANCFQLTRNGYREVKIK